MTLCWHAGQWLGHSSQAHQSLHCLVYQSMMLSRTGVLEAFFPYKVFSGFPFFICISICINKTVLEFLLRHVQLNNII